jgi:glycosyltransferase involved in cell wall biosynthesis
MSLRLGVLVDLKGMRAPRALTYLLELRERLGQEVLLYVQWARPDLPGLPDGVRLLRSGSGARSLASAGARAAEHGDLLVLLAPLLPDAAAVQGLLQGFDLDDLVGFTQPRFGDASGDGIWALPDGTAKSAEILPRQVLSLLPSHYLTTERLAACMAIRREVAAGFAAPSEAPGGLQGALLLELVNARRRGYRNLIMNRVVVPSSSTHEAAYPVLDQTSLTELYARRSDAYSGAEWFDQSSHQRRERLVAKARRTRPSVRMPLLLDCRGSPAHHNGTSEAIFGLIDGLVDEMPCWEIDLLFGTAAAEYHQVARRYPMMHVRTALPKQTYAAAVCLNQPWHLSRVAELHRCGLALVFNMLDTIAWDVVYLCNPDVTATWNFIASHADGLLYISNFTRERFNFRFPVTSRVSEAVTHLSLEPGDYRNALAAAMPEGDHILVFGNHYDHKGVGPAVDILSRAFPFQPIRALGTSAGFGSRDNVKALDSGYLPEAEIDRLIATARVVVFPSHYEGFGLPAIRALAYGRTVVVRSSSLWRELAGKTRMPGRLVEFVAPNELVEVVGKALGGEALVSLPFGDDLPAGTSPPAWRDCARRLVDLVEEVVAGADAERWYARDRSLGLARV